jgi:hypothetical protein
MKTINKVALLSVVLLLIIEFIIIPKLYLHPSIIKTGVSGCIACILSLLATQECALEGYRFEEMSLSEKIQSFEIHLCLNIGFVVLFLILWGIIKNVPDGYPVTWELVNISILSGTSLFKTVNSLLVYYLRKIHK